MKVLFITNIPSPYRMDFFNELGKKVELIVALERGTASDRDKAWLSSNHENFQIVMLETKSIGNESSIGFIGKTIKRINADINIFDGYSSPTAMLAITYCRFNRIKYLISSDGAFPSSDGFIKGQLKKYLIGGASAWLSTSKLTDEALIKYGAIKDRIYRYPFTSVRDIDILDECISREKKAELRNRLNIEEEKVVITVGQFIHRKGFDVLLKSLLCIPRDVGCYFIGGVATEEYLSFVKTNELSNVHFIGFKNKSELKEFYMAADLFVLPTREDIWGLVINEAMAYGLPVISTNKCMAALELVTPENGAIVPVDDVEALAIEMESFFNGKKNVSKCGNRSLSVIRNYTIERMAQRHLDILKKLCNKK